MIFGTETELDRPPDFRVGPYHVYTRPGLCAFLNGAAQWFRLAVWSSATAGYVGQAASNIISTGLDWVFVWSRARCVQHRDFERKELQFLKPLKKVKRLGYRIERILVVDDTPGKAARNYGNAIYVSSYEGSEADDELTRLLRYLELIHDVDDYRSIEKRPWRSLVSKR